ncbi:MAG: cytochrome c [Terracidiphilus sp.]|nr:cytochrome c [Terracidiphilus sp.]
MLKTFLAVTAVVLFALAPTPIIGGSPQDASTTASGKTTKPSAETMAKAKKVYAQDCALCHGDNGSGQTDVGKSVGVTSDWSKQATLAGKADDALFDMIRKGKGNMPPEAEGRADNATVHALIVYMRSFSKGDATATPETK